MANINGISSGNGAEVDSYNALLVKLRDENGAPLGNLKGDVIASTDRFIGIAGLNDLTYRPIRLSRSGAQAIERFTPLVNLNLYTAALPPNWLNPTTTFTTTIATTTGVLLNAAATGAVSSTAALISFAATPKYQKSPIHLRYRLKLVKGSTNGQADWGFFGTQAPAALLMPNGFVFLYGADGTLKPTYYFNGTVSQQGTDFAASIFSTNYYVWDIFVDDDSVTFIVQDASTGAIVNEQTLQIPVGDGRIGQQPYFFAGARSFVLSSAANIGTATQIYVGDATTYIMDTDTNKAWPHIQATGGMGAVVNPTLILTQLSNYANSAAPASATLSNTAAGYGNLGGQFQFAAVAGAETDYALFSFTVPTGVKFVCTGVTIDTMNTGAAVATTATWLQWFLGIDGLAVTLATNNYRVALGNQVFPIAAAIGAQAAVIRETFQTPYVTHSGRFFHVAVKMPLGTATASQVIRGTVRVEGYFE
jgi:hypothetical protein